MYTWWTSSTQDLAAQKISLKSVYKGKTWQACETKTETNDCCTMQSKNQKKCVYYHVIYF